MATSHFPRPATSMTCMLHVASLFGRRVPDHLMYIKKGPAVCCVAHCWLAVV
jgi:hypothetical protein